MTDRDWNPRYVAYARSHGHEPEAQRDHDRQRWPLAPTIPFTEWINARWREWSRLNNRDRWHHTDADHAAFDAWLTDRTDRLYSEAERLIDTPAFLADAIACEQGSER